jgi:hypothetical protein
VPINTLNDCAQPDSQTIHRTPSPLAVAIFAAMVFLRLSDFQRFKILREKLQL